MTPIEEIFKVPVYEVKLNLDLNALQSFCKDYESKDKGRVYTNIGGYQSNNLSLKEDALQPLLKEIENHCTLFSNSFINDKNQVVDTIWININKHKDINLSHNHPLSTLSGVYYVKAPPHCGSISFEHPALNVLSYYNASISVSNWNVYNSETWWKEAVENSLYIFPSWLNHLVGPNKNKTEERISISFNTN